VKRKTTGRSVLIDDELFLVTCDKTLPRHYTVSATFLLAMLTPQVLWSDGPEISALLYAGWTALATLGLSWLFDDRETYRLRKVAQLPVAEAGCPGASDPTPQEATDA